ncbi:UNVERIFIED_CONTAM: hypothetical protein K2H54_054524, partial [Gekko kuhli]
MEVFQEVATGGGEGQKTWPIAMRDITGTPYNTSSTPHPGSDNQSATQQSSRDGEDSEDGAVEAGAAHRH